MAFQYSSVVINISLLSVQIKTLQESWSAWKLSIKDEEIWIMQRDYVLCPIAWPINGLILNPLPHPQGHAADFIS